ncbi:hypothetical protein VUR80DRAFT_5279 [Thermomyces stellatus]
MASAPFLRLHTELQWNVRTIVCPELAFQPLLVDSGIDDTGKITQSNWLQDHTATVRTVLAVHQYPRRIALTALLDTLAFGDGFDAVRFRKERDVVMLSIDPDARRVKEFPNFRIMPSFSDAVVNLVLCAESDIFTMKWLKLYCCLPNLRSYIGRMTLRITISRTRRWHGASQILFIVQKILAASAVGPTFFAITTSREGMFRQTDSPSALTW